MKFKKIIPLFALCLSSLAIVTASTFGNVSEANEVVAYTNNDADTYYNGIADSLSGSALLSSLHSLNESKRQNLISYNSLFNYFSKTDPYPGGGTRAYYSGKAVKKVNREHVWPFSRLNEENVTNRGTYDIEKDLQMIRPAEASENEDRGNRYFGPENDDYYFDPGSLGVENYRGDAARIIFYCMIADTRLELTESSVTTARHAMGKLSALLEWNIKYPATEWEKTRNEAVESLQGHRNPFIDNPGYACRIWGNTNDLTKAICSKDPYNNKNIVDVTGITVDKSTVLLKKGETATLTANVVPNNASDQYVTWSSSTPLVASVNNGVISTSLYEGGATITATSHDGGYKASCAVIVADNPVRVTGVSYTTKTYTTTFGSSINVAPTVSPSNATYKACTYTSSDANIATVNDDGSLVTIGVGTVTITASSLDGGFSDTATVTVQPGTATGASFAESSYTLALNESKTIEVVFIPAGCTMPLTWSSSSPNIVSVDQNGVIKGLAVGRSFISIKNSSGKTLATAAVDVKQAGIGGCGGNITTTSMLLTLLASSGIILLLILKKKRV